MFLIIIIILFSFSENLVKQINITILALKKYINGQNNYRKSNALVACKIPRHQDCPPPPAFPPPGPPTPPQRRQRPVVLMTIYFWNSFLSQQNKETIGLKKVS